MYTSLILNNGTIKCLSKIEVGDVLISEDSNQCIVQSVDYIEIDLFKITNIKNESIVITKDQLITLHYSPSKVIYDNKKQQRYEVRFFDVNNRKGIHKSFSYKQNNDAYHDAEVYLNEIDGNQRAYYTLDVYNSLAKDKKKEFKTEKMQFIEFPEIKVLLDPYYIGLWLGDGTSANCDITTQESSIVKYLAETIPKYKCMVRFQSRYRYSISGTNGINYIRTYLKQYKLLNNKHIPNDYIHNSKENRMRLLAGIIDTDGNYDSRGNGYEIIQKNTRLAEDIKRLCITLGFGVSINKSKKSCMYKGEKREGEYNRIQINGEGLDEIPVLCPRKRAKTRQQKKNVLYNGIANIESLGVHLYPKITLDRDECVISSDGILMRL